MSCSPVVTDAAWATETVGRVSKKLAGRLTTHVDNFSSSLSVNMFEPAAFPRSCSQCDGSNKDLGMGTEHR